MGGQPTRLHAVPDSGNGLVEPRCPIDDEEFGSLQAALDEIVEDRAPSLGALATRSDALTPDDSRFITPETTPPSIPTNRATAPVRDWYMGSRQCNIHVRSIALLA